MADERVQTPVDGLVSFKDTLNLPRTDFPIRPHAAHDDPALIERWTRDDVYAKATHCNAGAPKFILHDGPPYANGHIHLGTAYNKILKDIISKSRRMMGYHTPVVPGWDCHGLPIEIKVSQEQPGITGQALKKACRAYARGWIDIQRNEFKRLGVMMDWQHPYITMDPAYEAETVRSFGRLVDRGYISRSNKTVAWCASCVTTLASAEIEYYQRKDPSLYVLFECDQKTVRTVFPALTQPVSFLIWTTTPWTLPLNRAVMLNPRAEYAVAQIGDHCVIVGAQRVQALAELVGQSYTILVTCKGVDLASVFVHHPFEYERLVPCVMDESVGVAEGTACVHTAPGCGPLDYEVGVKNGLEIYSPVSPEGSYTAAIYPQELVGMPVVDGQIWAIKKLHETGKLFHKGSITHSYPHCWRCRKGLIFRATPQWFFNLEHGDLKQHALQEIAAMNFFPAGGRNFLKATVENRWEWCLSRQRAWGNPIPALLCSSCDYAYTSYDFVNKIVHGIAEHGIEYWDMVTVNDIKPEGLVCPTCTTSEFVKETDILDVWFDSGVSHQAVLEKNSELAMPADLYLEGIDQHRGWFQSSLLTSVALSGGECTKMIMTHGYTVDGQGRKMSKSLGNVVAPQDVIDKVGTDVLRLWVSSLGTDGDVIFSEVLLKNVAEVYRKIRNTARGLLMNLYDYNHARDAVTFTQLSALDRYALAQLYALNQRVIKAYARYDVSAVFHALADYCAVELSSFYLDVVKDRLYCDKADGHARRSAQTTLWYILDTLIRLMAPVLSCTAELLSDAFHVQKTDSIHLQHFATLQEFVDILPLRDSSTVIYGHTYEFVTQLESLNEFIDQQTEWDMLKEIRSALLKAIEGERAAGNIKHSLEARLVVFVDPKMQDYERVKEMITPEFLKEFLIVSQVELVSSVHDLPETQVRGLYARVEHARGVKCPRCWQWEESIHEHGLCTRCAAVVK